MSFKSNDPTLPDGPGDQAQQPHRWLTGKRLLWMGLLIVLVLFAAAAYWPVDYSVKVSPETTYLTGPLREDGTVDYVEAFRRRLGADHIATDENAVRLFAQAFGPRFWSPRFLDDALMELGLSSLPTGGDYFVKFRAFVKTLPADQREFDADGNDLYVDEALPMAMKTPWSADQYPRIAQWLADIDGPLALIVQASERPHFCFPIVPRDAERLYLVLFPGVSRFRHAAKALVARAMLRSALGDLDGARADLLACHRMGWLVGRERNLISYLVGIAIDTIAYNADLALLKTGLLSREQTAAILADLQARPPVRPVADSLHQGERLFVLDCIQELAGSTPSAVVAEFTERYAIGRRNINWNIPLRMANEYLGGLIAALGKADYGDYRLAYQQWERDTEKWITSKGMPSDESIDYVLYRAKLIALRLSGNLGRPELSRIAGAVVIQYVVPSVNRGRDLEERLRMWDELTKLALALSLYKHDHGQYPDDLAALAGDYLPAVFEDRFTGDPLHYQRQGQGYLLYSVGWDQTDDGGLDADGEPADDDIVVQIK